MQQTKKYKFNLIENSDTFSAQPLNDNMAKVETALDAADTALATHQTEMTAALASHQAQVNAALASHRTEVSTALANQTAQTAGRAQFAVVRRTGDGSTSYTVTFPFQPKLVMFAIAGVSIYGETSIVCRGQELCSVFNHDYMGLHYLKMAWNGNSLTVSANVEGQYPDSYYNSSGCEYLVAALG